MLSTNSAATTAFSALRDQGFSVQRNIDGAPIEGHIGVSDVDYLESGSRASASTARATDCAPAAPQRETESWSAKKTVTQAPEALAAIRAQYEALAQTEPQNAIKVFATLFAGMQQMHQSLVALGLLNGDSTGGPTDGGFARLAQDNQIDILIAASVRRLRDSNEAALRYYDLDVQSVGLPNYQTIRMAPGEAFLTLLNVRDAVSTAILTREAINIPVPHGNVLMALPGADVYIERNVSTTVVGGPADAEMVAEMMRSQEFDEMYAAWSWHAETEVQFWVRDPNGGTKQLFSVPLLAEHVETRLGDTTRENALRDQPTRFAERGHQRFRHVGVGRFAAVAGSPS